MRRLRILFRQAEFHVLLFCLGFILLNWPFLGLWQGKLLASISEYLFGIWGVAIILLFLISRACSGSDQPEDMNGENDA